MLNKTKPIKLLDLIDVAHLQNFQDFFAKATDIACLTLDENGPITKPSNYNDFCKFNIKNNSKKNIECDLNDTKWGEIAAKQNKPLIFKCKTGLTSFVVPIIIDGKNLGAIVGGQIFTKEPNEKPFRKFARENNLNEEDYINKLRKIKIVSNKNLKSAVNSLLLLANFISNIGNKNLEIIKNNEKENLYRKLVEAIRSSLDVDETLNIISTEITKMFNFQRIIIIEVPNRSNLQEFIIKKEYKTSKDIKHTYDVQGYDKIFKFSAEYILKTNKNLVINNINDSEYPEYYNKYYADIGIKSIIWLPIMSKNELWGFISLGKTENYIWQDEDIQLLELTAHQLFIAINQAKLYLQEKQTAQRETILRKSIDFLRNKLYSEDIKKYFTKITRAYFNADRCIFIDFDKYSNKFFPINIENLKSNNIKSFIGTDVEEKLPEFNAKLKKGKDIIIRDLDKFLSKKKTLNFVSVKTLHIAKIKSDYALVVKHENRIYGALVIHFVNEKKSLTHEEFNFLKTLRNQVAIALNNAEMFENEKNTARRETLLRNIFEAMRSSLDINVIKNTIVEETGKALNADRCIIRLFSDNTYSNIDVKKSVEYLKNKNFSIVNINPDVVFLNYIMLIFNKNENVSVTDIENSSIEPKLITLLKKFHIKSMYSSPIRKNSKIIGYIIVEYKNKVILKPENIDLLNTIATQSGIALHQAELYDMTQIQSEREKINRKMLEILRSSIDKKIIKYLFVQNIGKLFKADRVFFADYDGTKNMYLPVEKGCEYLSSPNEKSFVGYDWSQDSAKEYIQPLLEKREILINCWQEYIKNHLKSADFIALFEDANVQSSYNLPVLYQEIIIGYFCIEFTGSICKNLPEEDINRLRNICSQAAIALYHSDLYVKAIESARSKEKFIENISNELQIPLENLMNISMQFLNNEFNIATQTEFSTTINKNYKLLLDIKNNVTNIAQIESENFKLNYEQLNSEQIIMSVFEPVMHIAENKNIIFNANLAKAYIHADKLRLKQILYNLFTNIINITPENSKMQVESIVQDNKLIISIINFGTGHDINIQNKIFETLKQIDSSSTMTKTNINLGFSIAKKLIELHNSKIYVDSTEDKGTKLWFVLPTTGIN